MNHLVADRLLINDLDKDSGSGGFLKDKIEFGESWEFPIKVKGIDEFMFPEIFRVLKKLNSRT